VSDFANGGYACPYIEETRGCNAAPCAIDCALDSWGTWSTCTQSCDSGFQYRTRGIVTAAQYGGAECAYQRTVRSCNDERCPVDCAYDNWDDWSTCTKSCGSAGTQKRSRAITTTTDFGGIACPHSSETRPCNVTPCAVHCVVSAFDAWSTCTASCGSDGAQSRSRSVVSTAAHGGYVCPYLEETRSCNSHACAVDCVVTEYNVWSACTMSCGAGSQERTRSIGLAVTNGGVECPT
jgi:hypothetical protein